MTGKKYNKHMYKNPLFGENREKLFENKEWNFFEEI